MDINLSSKNKTSILLTVLMLGGCSDSKLPKYYKLGAPRVLALQANTPEVNPGATVTITPLVSDLEGGTRTLTYTAESCLDPGVGLGAEPTCAADSSHSHTTGTFTLTDSRHTGVGPTFTVTVPALLLTGLSATLQYNGVPYLVVYTLEAGGQSYTAYKRIIASTRPSKNTNPTVAAILADGSAISTMPGDAKDLGLSLGSGAESYLVKNSDLTTSAKTETLTATWLIGSGDVKYSRTNPDALNHYTPAASDYPAFLVVIIRDDRGGVSFLGVPSL